MQNNFSDKMLSNFWAFTTLWMQSLTTEQTTSSSQGDSSIKTRYGSHMVNPMEFDHNSQKSRMKTTKFPLIFSFVFLHVIIYFYFIWNCDFHGVFAYQSFNFQHFYECVSENHWVFLVQNTKKLLQPDLLKRGEMGCYYA